MWAGKVKRDGEEISTAVTTPAYRTVARGDLWMLWDSRYLWLFQLLNSVCCCAGSDGFRCLSGARSKHRTPADRNILQGQWRSSDGVVSVPFRKRDFRGPHLRHTGWFGCHNRGTVRTTTVFGVTNNLPSWDSSFIARANTPQSNGLLFW